MILSSGTNFNLKRGEIRVFYGEITLDHDDTIRAWINCPGKAECLSVEGQNYLGEWFDKLDKKAAANVPKRLWFYVKAPDAAGKYNGTITVTNTARKVFANIAIVLNVSDEVAEEDQFTNGSDLRRLFWLNSKLAINNEVPKPYTPVEYDGRYVKILGREIELDEYGLPKRITSHFGKDVTISSESYEVLSDRIKFTVGEENFKIISSGATKDSDAFSFASVSESDSFMMKTRARIEFDGFCDYKITLIAKRDVKISNVNLCLPITDYSREYFMGLGKEGGKFDGKLDFKWDSVKNQDGFWVGNVNAGIRVKFKSSNYKKPLTDEYYQKKPLVMPKSWDNDGHGGIFYDSGSFFAYSDGFELAYGKKLSFDFELSITPVKPINESFNSASAANIPYGTKLNPYKNYPFFEETELSDFISKAHSDGKKAIIYYTLRELTDKAPEFSAFADFDCELLEPAFEELDSARIANGESRMCNFYAEALNRLVEKHEIDGICLDGAEFDRNTMKRVRRILDKRENAEITLNATPKFTEESGFSSSLLIYTELLPYVDKLTVSASSEKSDAYKLVELSGIPFGIKADVKTN